MAFLLVSFALSRIAAQSSDDVERYAEQGQQALTQGHYAEAEQAFEKLRQLQPGVAEVHANLGLIYFEERKYDQAVIALRQALKLKPSLQRSDTLLAISLSELSRYKEALPGLEKGFHNSKDADTTRMCGLQLLRAYEGLQRDNQAVQVALELNRSYPSDPEVLYQSGKIFGNSAFLAMERLVKVAPNSVWRHQAAAEADESQGSYDAAMAEYRQVLALDPNRPGVHYRVGRTLLARSHDKTSPEDVAAALAEFDQELQVDPSNANAAYEIGEIHRQAGRFEESQKFFALALKSYPDFEEAHTGLASVLISLKRPQDALVHLQKSVVLNPDDEVAWFRLAQVQRTLGNSSEQKKALAEFARLRQQFNQQKEVGPVFSPHDVTKQAVDPNVQ